MAQAGLRKHMHSASCFAVRAGDGPRSGYGTIRSLRGLAAFEPRFGSTSVSPFSTGRSILETRCQAYYYTGTGFRGNQLGRRNAGRAYGEGVTNVANKQIMDKISIYVPQKKMGERPVERLIELAEKKDRSVNYLVVDAILEYIKREEKIG